MKGTSLVVGLSIACTLLSGGAQAALAQQILVPGTMESVGRLYGGLGAAEPREFLGNLLKVLLDQKDPQQRSENVPSRVWLLEYLEDLADLRKAFGNRIEVAAKPKAARKRFDKLADDLGFRVKFRKGEVQVVGKEGRDEERRRRLATALGWSVESIAQRIERGERAVLEIGDDRIESFIPLSVWARAIGDPVPGERALEILARDQRLGFVLAGLLRVDEKTARSLVNSGLLETLYRDHSAAFFRYSAALRIEGGSLVTPGDAPALWQGLVGESPRDIGRFLPALLGRKGGRVAFLWEALWSAPPRTAAFYIGSESKQERRYLRRVLGKLNNTTEEEFDWAVGGNLGFGTFVRSVPIVDDGSRLDLPGGPGLWWVAIRGDEAPTSRETLARIVRRGLKTELDDGELILKVLNSTVDMGDYNRPALPRLIRVANLFPERRELLVPEAIVLATRLVDYAPAALDVLESLPMSRPEDVVDYLWAVSESVDFPRNAEAEVRVATFQAGIEALRELGAAGNLPGDELSKLFLAWVRIDLASHDPKDLVPRELDWIRRLVETLPPVEAGPGRGPAERALLAALSVERDPLRFSWSGVDYQGERGLARRRIWARFLLDQQVPSLDELLALADALDRLGAACEAMDIPAAREAIASSLERLGAMPAVDLSIQKDEATLAARTLPIDRPILRDMLEKARKVKKGKRLRAVARQLHETMGELLREIRVVLLSVPYLAATTTVDPMVAAAPGLVRSHVLLRHFDSPREGDNGWSWATLERDESGAGGGRVAGPVAGVPRALANASLGGALGGHVGGGSRVGLAALLELDFEDLARTRWHAITPEISRAVARTLDAGEAAVRALRAQDKAPDQVREALQDAAFFVPAARLFPSFSDGNKRTISLSERLQLGFALLALDPSERVDGLADAVEEMRRSLEAIGDDARSAVERAVGGSMPAAVGRPGATLFELPSFESLDHESGDEALSERLRLELKLAVIAYLGRHDFPGELGGDLFEIAMTDPMRPVGQVSDDWEVELEWTTSLDDEDFDGWLRALLASGRYSLADS